MAWPTQDPVEGGVGRSNGFSTMGTTNLLLETYSVGNVSAACNHGLHAQLVSNLDDIWCYKKLTDYFLRLNCC